jgi:hypothetical protein
MSPPGWFRTHRMPPSTMCESVVKGGIGIPVLSAVDLCRASCRVPPQDALDERLFSVQEIGPVPRRGRQGGLAADGLVRQWKRTRPGRRCCATNTTHEDAAEPVATSVAHRDAVRLVFCCAVPLPVQSVPMWQPMTRLSMVGSDMCHISMVGSDMPHIDGWEWHTTRRWLEVTYHTAMVGRDMPRVDVSRVDRGWFGQVRLGCDTARLQAHPPVIPDRAILGLFITRSPRVTRVT